MDDGGNNEGFTQALERLFLYANYPKVYTGVSALDDKNTVLEYIRVLKERRSDGRI